MRLAALVLRPTLCPVGGSWLTVGALSEGTARSALSRGRCAAPRGRACAALLRSALIALAARGADRGVRLALLRLLGKSRRRAFQLTALVAHLDFALSI